MSKSIDFYYNDLSPPSRTVWMILLELGIPFTPHPINLREGEQKNPEYAKINVRQKVPAIKDGDFCLGESRAVAAYLVSQYGDEKGKRYLYPADAKKRARIDQHLYISENIVEAMVQYLNIGGVLSRGEQPKPEKLEDVKKYLGMLEKFLNDNEYTADDHLTLADFFYFMSISFLFLIDFDHFKEFPKFEAWIKKMQSLPYYKETSEGPLKQFRERYQNALKGGDKPQAKE